MKLAQQPKMKCPHCDFVAVNPTGLSAHLRHKHKDVPEETPAVTIIDLEKDPTEITEIKQEDDQSYDKLVHIMRGMPIRDVLKAVVQIYDLSEIKTSRSEITMTADDVVRK